MQWALKQLCAAKSFDLSRDEPPSVREVQLFMLMAQLALKPSSAMTMLNMAIKTMRPADLVGCLVEKGKEDRDDRDRHEHLDEGESTAFVVASRHGQVPGGRGPRPRNE